ncbi:MAG TPA: signal peptidase II [Dehalococcoidia bacterium]|nr:signal peptidase II [Dehalococcoidia bacterium]
MPTEPAAPQSRPLHRDFTVLQAAILVLLLDQLSKYVVIQSLSPGFSFPFRGIFRITHVHNTGSAFGILQGLNTPLIFVSFIGIVILVLIYRSQPHPSNWLRLSLALQLGGAFGNLIDRMRLGYVTDFIDIGPWPVFNLADASIVSGLIILAWVLTRGRSPKEQPQQQTAPAVAGGDPGGDELEDDLDYRSLVIPFREMREMIEGNEPDPVDDLTRDRRRETPPTLVEDADQRPAEPERLC